MLKFLSFLMALYGTFWLNSVKAEDEQELNGEKLLEFLKTKPKLWEVGFFVLLGQRVRTSFL
jgi:hypothetical protein